MGKKMTKAGAELRRAIRADADADPAIDHKALRSKYAVGEYVVESALAKTVPEWDAAVAVATDEPPRKPAPPATVVDAPHAPPGAVPAPPAAPPAAMPGLEQGIVKFTRKAGRMGTDFIFWIPRVYVKNGLVDPKAEYDVFLKKKA